MEQVIHYLADCMLAYCNQEMMYACRYMCESCAGHKMLIPHMKLCTASGAPTLICVFGREDAEGCVCVHYMQFDVAVNRARNRPGGGRHSILARRSAT